MLLLSGLALALPCRTPELRLNPRTSTAPGVMSSMTRPPEAGYVDSTIYPIRIHYRKAGDAERAETVVLPIAEDVWKTEIVDMGWQQPPADYGAGGSDSYDIYLTNYDTAGGAWTYTTYDNGVEPDAIEGDGLYTNSSYIAIDDDESWIPDESMAAFVSHEFNHACQYATDANEYTLFAWESTAEATSEIYSGLGREYKIEVHDFQSHPSLSILFDAYIKPVSNYGYDTYYYEYGGWIFGSFMEERFGTRDGTTLRRMWENMVDGERSKEPDFLDGIEAVAGEGFADAADVYMEFAEWRLLLADYDDGEHYAQGADLPTEALVGFDATLQLSTIDGTSVTPAEEPYGLGMSAWIIQVDAASERSLHLVVDGDEATRWGVVAAGIAEDGTTTVLRARGDKQASLDLPLSGLKTILVAVPNLGPEGFDPEDSDITDERSFTLGFSVTDPAVADEDSGGAKDSGADAESGGCGCASGGSGAGVFALLGFLALRRR